jgi:hypothetical protein
MARIAILALALTATLGGALGGANEAAAANGYEQWTGPYNDQCYYFWDGYDYASVACPRSDGGYDFYFAGYGEWVYSFCAGFLNTGGVWLYYDGLYYYNTVSNGYVDGIYPTTATIGGATWSGLTDNVLINQIMIDSNNAIIDNILAPNCIEVVGNTCYY